MEKILRSTDHSLTLNGAPNDVSTACEHSLGKLGIPEAQTLALSLTGSCMLLLQACHGKLGLDRDQAGLWTPGRLAYGFV
ncbi:hypothetical protein CFAM422_005817 [Trichoderma lentiforme]|uniref:Uncharacterized protein n=1 Tax=Trichoderma lentiforme TaxID=1567552 RepID=A0A9P4XFU8_9HYPO|nr:hypothetical protein CFAM422_005817 [Trichoderma lentiforme]